MEYLSEILIIFLGILGWAGYVFLKKYIESEVNKNNQYFSSELSKEVEKLKNKLDELSHYKKHYYEDEFNFYKKISGKLFLMGEDLSELKIKYSLFRIQPCNKTKKEMFFVYASFFKNFNDFRKLATANYPFYPREIYLIFEEFIKKSLDLITEMTSYAVEIRGTEELSELSIYPSKTKKLPEDFNKLIEILESYINDTIFYKIRIRIDNYRLKKDIN